MEYNYYTYEERWIERKSFLRSSTIIGAILAAAFSIWAMIEGIKNSDGLKEILSTILGSLVVFIIFLLIFSALIAVGRLIFGGSTGGNLVTNAMNGFWVMCISTVTSGGIGMVIGAIMFFGFVFLFMAVAAGFAVYLPISSIYLYVMYRQEMADMKTYEQKAETEKIIEKELE